MNDIHNPLSSVQVDDASAASADSPFRGASRFNAALATDPDLDPSISHECHCLRCDSYWQSEPARPSRRNSAPAAARPHG